MIGKIDTSVILEKALSPSASFRRGEGSDFQSLLKGKIENSIPLEKIALEYLKKALEFALLETKHEETYLSLSPSLLLPLRPSASQSSSSQPQPSEFQPELFEIEPEFEVSNNLPREQDFEPIIRDAGQKYGVDQSLIKAVIQVESGGYPLAVSKAGARGLMQLMPGTAADLGVTNPFDPAQNIMGGTRYLRNLLDRYRGDVKLALAAYNWGMGNLEKRPESMPRETKNYISQVENYYRNYSKV
jgi:soluble lytic murein transglycosylase-like protein